MRGKTLDREPARDRKLGSRAPQPLYGLERLQRAQRLLGNRDLVRFLQSNPRISEPNDRHEQEADRVASRVVAGAGQRQHDRRVAERALAERLNRRAGRAAGSCKSDQVAASELVALGPGRPLESGVRAFFEGRFGHGFDDVRIHTGRRAARIADAIAAEAFTYKHHVGFAPRGYSPQTAAGRRLLAHELTHVLQQTLRRDSFFGADRSVTTQQTSPKISSVAGRGTRPVIQRRVTDRYREIQNRLSYQLIDWAITGAEARDVLGILAALSERDLADTVVALERDGLLERLLGNISAQDQESQRVLIGRIHRYRPTGATAERIAERLSYGLFDWEVTDRDAHDVLVTLMGLESQQLRTIIANMVNEGYFDRLMDNLGEEDHRQFRAFIQRLRDIRDEFRELVGAHVEFLRRGPGGAGRRIRRTVERTGYGGRTPTFPNLPRDQQRDWHRRAAEVISEVRDSVRGTELEDIFRRSRIVFDPEGAERLGTRPGSEAYAFVTGENVLRVGRKWVQNAEDDPRNVWQSIAHELSGHEEFGLTWSWEIMSAAFESLTAAERREALGAVGSLYSAYGYSETELYAELREVRYRRPESGGDVPAEDVPRQLRRILRAFGPRVGRQIIARFYKRVVNDPRISVAAKRLLYDSIQSVFPPLFPLFPLTSPLAPY